MATQVSLSAGHPFPPGTSVQFIPRTLRTEVAQRRATAKHKVEPVTATVVVGAGGACTATGLTPNTWYWAHAVVNGTAHWLAVHCPA